MFLTVVTTTMVVVVGGWWFFVFVFPLSICTFASLKIRALSKGFNFLRILIDVFNVRSTQDGKAESEQAPLFSMRKISLIKNSKHIVSKNPWLFFYILKCIPCSNICVPLLCKAIQWRQMDCHIISSMHPKTKIVRNQTPFLNFVRYLALLLRLTKSALPPHSLYVNNSNLMEYHNSTIYYECADVNILCFKT